MGGTIGGATTVTPEYLTETQYYSPSEFEDISRRQKPQENVLIGNNGTLKALNDILVIFGMLKKNLMTLAF